MTGDFSTCPAVPSLSEEGVPVISGLLNPGNAEQNLLLPQQPFPTRLRGSLAPKAEFITRYCLLSHLPEAGTRATLSLASSWNTP